MASPVLALRGRCRALPTRHWNASVVPVTVAPGPLRSNATKHLNASETCGRGLRGVAVAYQADDAFITESTAASGRGLSAVALLREAQIARLTGACYHEWEDLKRTVQQENFEVLAGGDTYFTRWFIARGVLGNEVTTSTGGQGDLEAAHSSSSDRAREETTLIISRGVMWRSADVDSLRVWQQLSQSWPEPFLHEQLGRMPGGGVVQCHKGINSMASELLDIITPHLKQLSGPISFAGHSLGGSLSKLMAAKLIVSHNQHNDNVFVHTFGSPPAFSCSCGGHGSQILQHLGIPQSHIRNWAYQHWASSISQRRIMQVLDYDPVPRAMISADPYYQLALKNSTLRNVLQFGEWVLGPNAPNPKKFLFRNVGDVFLLSVARPADAVQPLSEETLEETLEMPLEDFVSRPALLLQTVLDHNHWSYSNDLTAAARLQQKREQREARALARHELSNSVAGHADAVALAQATTAGAVVAEDGLRLAQSGVSQAPAR